MYCVQQICRTEQLSFSQTQISDLNRLRLWKSCHTFSSSSTLSKAALCREDTHKSCPLRRVYGESFLFMLANNLQVLPWGSVIVGHLRHRWREGNYRVRLPKWQSCVQRMWNALVCVWTLAHAHLNVVWHPPQPCAFFVSCMQTHTLAGSHEQKRFYDKFHKPSLHTVLWLPYISPLPVTLSYSHFSNFWSVTNGIYRPYVSWERLSLILDETQWMYLCQW